jgi:transcriptional regulator with XRE-family HTH domain
MEDFGRAMRQRRRSLGWSLRHLESVSGVDYGYLGQIERGERRCSGDYVQIIDQALGADGALARLLTGTGTYVRPRPGEDSDMQRRTVLMGLALGAASPTMATEALRHSLDQAAGAGPAEWQAIAADYARDFYTTPSAALVDQLGVDLAILQQLLSTTPDADLARAAGQLAVVMAMSLAATGRAALARRWWRTARRYADQSTDIGVMVWVRDWEVVNGTYERRPVGQLLDLADETIGLAGDRVCAGTAGVISGKSQALAVAGAADAATDALRLLEDLTARMPAAVMADEDSMFGWPEVRLHHTASYVLTHIGRPEAAMAAQDRALELYPATLARERAQMQMHRASCLIQQGHIPDGLRYAADVLDELPTAEHTALLYEVGQRVCAAVPAADRRRPEADELRDRLRSLPADG